MLDPIGKLQEDHRVVRDLFQQFEHADDQSRQQIADEALTQLETHSILEEELIYPAIRQTLHDKQMIDKALEEHHVVSLIGTELRQMQVADERYRAKFQVLADLVRHHIEEEETTILARAAKADIDWTPIGAKATYLLRKLMGVRHGEADR